MGIFPFFFRWRPFPAKMAEPKNIPKLHAGFLGLIGQTFMLNLIKNRLLFSVTLYLNFNNPGKVETRKKPPWHCDYGFFWGVNKCGSRGRFASRGAIITYKMQNNFG